MNKSSHKNITCINKTEYNNLNGKMPYIAMLKCILYTYLLRDGIDVISYKSSRLM